MGCQHGHQGKNVSGECREADSVFLIQDVIYNVALCLPPLLA